MIILAIETSCDETAAAIVEDGTKILSDVVASSQKFHIKTGGIVPETAAREQIKYLIPVVNQALREAFPKNLRSITYAMRHVDAFAVTVGPGLIGSLLVGVETAKTLAYLWKKPIVPINHLIAHLYANWLEPVPRHLSGVPQAQHHLKGAAPSFPAIGLIVSGGHTDLLLMKTHGRFQWLGGTRDDAAGEAFDKIARLLGLPYPGGPAIAAEAAKLKIENLKLKIKLPRPMLEEENFDFSFSGLKTAVLREVNKLKVREQWNTEVMEQLSFEVQEAITDVLVTKTIRAAEKYKVKSVILGGGVTANERLREKFKVQSSRLPKPGTGGQAKFKVDLWIPPANLCTDNAAVVASCAHFNYHPKPWKKIEAYPGLYF